MIKVWKPLNKVRCKSRRYLSTGSIFTRNASRNGPNHLKHKSTNFVGLDLSNIVIVDSQSVLSECIKDLRKCEVLGVDTESKPTRISGEKPMGPHLIQISTLKRAYLFHIRDGCDNWNVFELEKHKQLKLILESEQYLKAGFALTNDRFELKSKLGIEVRRVVDLSWVLREEGEVNNVGAVGAMKKYLGVTFTKRKTVTCSNWSMPYKNYTKDMITYAANDAYVALLMYYEWRKRLDSDPPSSFVRSHVGTEADFQKFRESTFQYKNEKLT